MTSPERRAEVIAGIRALADFIEANTELPTPNSVGAQYSILADLTPEMSAEVRRLAEAFGLQVENDTKRMISAQREIAGGYTSKDGVFRVHYVIHGSRSTSSRKPAGGVS